MAEQDNAPSLSSFTLHDVSLADDDDEGTVTEASYRNGGGEDGMSTPPSPPPSPPPSVPPFTTTLDETKKGQIDLEKAMGGRAVAEEDAAKQGADEKKELSQERKDEERSEPYDAEEQRWRFARMIGLTKFNFFFWGTVFIVPYIFIVLVLLIPLGEPDSVFDKHGSWPFIFFVNPIIMALLAYLNLTPYWGCHGDERPFTFFPEKLPIMVTVYVLEIAIILPLVLLFDFFSFIGLISLGISFIVAFFSTWVWQRLRRNKPMLKLFRQYMKVVTLLYIHLVLLSIYVILFRELPSDLQPVLTFALSIVVFINRKIMLSFTDPFPIELAMLISGFWINNMSDMFQTLAFPNVKDPITFLYIWLINFIGDVANLIFLTAPWFRFRVWIKNVLMCKCRKLPKPDLSESDPDERGHSNNRPGYRRRQARFYFWRITSKILAILFYLTISIVLRYYSVNSLYYNFSDDPYRVVTSSGGSHPNILSHDDYAHSMVYVSCNLFITLLAGLVGYCLLRWRYTETFRQLKPVVLTLIKNHTFIGFIASIVTFNGLMAVAFLQYHQRVWWYDLEFI